MMTFKLRAQLFGGLSLSYGDQPISSVSTPRLQSLLAYLLLHHGVPLSRRHTAYLFWPDASETRARNNLRQFLHQLRQILPDADSFIRADASTFTWYVDPDGMFALDVADFERALADANAAERRGDARGARSALDNAVTLYRGDLLPSCYDDWITESREQLRAQYADALKRLARLLEEHREYAAAIPHRHHLIKLDPLDESLYVDAMRLHALENDPAGVRRVYKQCADTLRRELASEPAPATREAYERMVRSPGTRERRDATSGTRTLIGRQREWGILRSSWERASAGRSHLVLISGEAGIGKTRLAEELLSWAARQGITTARTRSYAAEGGMALGPVNDWLRSQAIRQSMDRLSNVWLTEIARILPELLVERPDLERPRPITQFGERQRFFEALARAMLAAPQPLLLLIDDLQWCDQETLQWLHFLLRFRVKKRLLITSTVRVEDVLPARPVTDWLMQLRSEGRVSEITLGPLDASETAQLAARVVNDRIDDQLAVRLYRETEGNPLFVVEVANAGLSAYLPPRIHAVIAHRLAQLSPAAHELAGLAATMGRVFTAEVMGKAADIDERGLTATLEELWQRHVIRAASQSAFDFSHDKIRDVAYSELSPIRQRHWHLRIAQALAEVHAADLDPVSAQLAVHYEQAGEALRAIPFYQRAAELAQDVYAHAEAVGILKHCLELLAAEPDLRRREERQLDLLRLLSLALVATFGYGAPEVLDALSRAHLLNQRLGKPPDPLILRAQAIAHAYSRNFQESLGSARQLLELAKDKHDPILTVEGHYALGVSLFWIGSFARSREHLEQALASYDSLHAQAHIQRYSQDPDVVCRCRLAFDLWCLGYPEQARAVQGEGLARAQALAHPFSLAYALTWDAMLHCAMGAAGRALESVEKVIALSEEYDFGLWSSWALVLSGWAVGQEGQSERAIAELQRGDELMRARGALFLRPFVSALIAEQLARMGKVEHGLELLDDALTTVPDDQYWSAAELHRLHGALLLTKGVDARQVEAAYCRAIDVARAQRARLFEFRAATGLAQLWHDQGRPVESRTALTEVYEWFSEGFDMPEWKSARELLASDSENSRID
jgi:DNA-binding SARP family transcriptional activator